MQNIWNFLKDSFNPIVTQIKDELLPQFKEAWEQILPVLRDFWGAIGDFLGPALELLAYTTIPDVVAAVQTIITWFSVFVGIAGDTAKAVGDAWDAFKNRMGEIFGGTSDIVSSIWHGLVGIITGLAHGSVSEVVGAFRGMWDGVKGGVERVVHGVKGLLDDLATIAHDAGSKIMSRLARGLIETGQHAVDAVRNVVSHIRNLFPHSPAKEGPFSGSNWGGWGESIMAELARGFNASAGVPVRAASSALAALSKSLGLDSVGYEQGKSYAEAIADGLSHGLVGARSAFDSLPGNFDGVTANLAASAGGGSGGTTINQNFDTKVYRSGDDLWTAAPILYRQAEREARSVAR